MTMQYNSVSIPQSKSIINAIDWINHNTPIGSSVIIDKNWRGWTELELKQRSFNFYEKVVLQNEEIPTRLSSVESPCHTIFMELPSSFMIMVIFIFL